MKARFELELERWWLTGGEEPCPHCGQLYAYEIEVRCQYCDSPGCLQCMVQRRERHACPDCAGELVEQGSPPAR